MRKPVWIVQGMDCGGTLMCPSNPLSGLTGTSIASGNVTAGLQRDCLGWREVPHPRTQPLPRPANIQWLISQAPLPQPRTTLNGHPSFTAPHDIFPEAALEPSFALCPNLLSLHFLFLSFPRCWSQQHSLINFQHANLHHGVWVSRVFP